MKEKSERRNCVRCGKNLSEKQKLWCENCIKYVNDELEGKTDLPLHFFFKWNLRHKKGSDLFINLYQMTKEKEIGTLKASRDYRKEKAKKLAIELEYYKKKAKYLELAVKIWSEGKSELLDNGYQPQNPEPYGKGVWEIMKD